MVDTRCYTAGATHTLVVRDPNRKAHRVTHDVTGRNENTTISSLLFEGRQVRVEDGGLEGREDLFLQGTAVR